MTADIKARVVATDRLVVNFKCSPCRVMGSLRRQIRATKFMHPSANKVKTLLSYASSHVCKCQGAFF